MFFISYSNYKTLKDRTKRDYNATVTASDEAFVWQVMTYYYPLWKSEGSDLVPEDDSVEESVLSGGKSGPKAGFKNTAGKTIGKFNEYIIQVGKSREGRNAELWGDRMKLAAIRTAADMKTPEPDIEGTGVDYEYLQYTKLNLHDLEEQDNIEDDVNGYDYDEMETQVPVRL